MNKKYWWTNKDNKTPFYSTNYDMLLHWLNSGVNFKLDINELNEHYIFKKNTKYYIDEEEAIMVDSYDCNILNGRGKIEKSWIGGDEWYFTHTNFLEKAIFTELTDEKFKSYNNE